MIHSQVNAIYIFDLDGTLTPTREKMSQGFVKKFELFLQQHIAYIVSGSDYSKVKQQVPSNILELFCGVYSSMGNELYIKDKLIYKNQFTPENNLIEMLNYYRKVTKYSGIMYNNYIEKRNGMINFSVLGRDSTIEARKHYNEWDKLNKEREYIRKQLLNKYPDYGISLGGEISIDIVPNGYGKEQTIAHLRKKYKKEKIIFFGDRTEKGGNDYSIAQCCKNEGNAEVVSVDNPEDCIKKLGI